METQQVLYGNISFFIKRIPLLFLMPQMSAIMTDALE